MAQRPFIFAHSIRNRLMGGHLSRRPLRLLAASIWLPALLLGMGVAGLAIQPVVAAAPAPAAVINAPVSVVVVGALSATLYDKPDGKALKVLTPAVVVNGIGRDASGNWLFVQQQNGNTGWVQAGQVIAFGIDGLPTVNEAGNAPAQPLPAATAQATPDANALAAASTDAALSAAVAPTATTPVAAPTASAGTLASPVTATVTLTDARLNVRAGPGLNYAIVAKALPGAVYAVLARDATGQWIQIDMPERNDIGWVAAQYVTVSTPVNALVVSARVDSPPAASAAAPAATSTIYPASTVQPAAVSGGLSGVLVFQVKNGGDIYAYNLRTGSMRHLTQGFDPAISPDGSKVAFTRIGGENGLYIINIDGSNEHRIYAGGENLRAPSWSPDGQYIVFTRGAAGDFCRMTSRGACVPPDTPGATGALVRQNTTVLSRVDIDGNNYQDVPSLLDAVDPNWSAGGIVYATKYGLEITQDAPAARSQNLIKDTYDEAPAWQPNGGRILFQRRDADHWEVYTVNSDGSGLAGMTHPATTFVDQQPSNVAPAWSPDGQHIVFFSNRNRQKRRRTMASYG